MIEKIERNQMFISYSQKDRYWLEKLRTMLAPLSRQGIKVWAADKDIAPGQQWKEEIAKALASAKVAVLLVSPDFLASDFIGKHELPPLLKAAEDEGLTIIWVPVRACFYELTVIADYQAVHDPETPLAILSEAHQEVVLTKIVKTIAHAIRATPSPKKPVVSKPTPTVVQPPLKAPVPSLPPIQTIHGWSSERVQALQQQTVQALSLAVEFRDTLESGDQGPTMVVIPGGRFLMGSPEDEPERQDDERQHEVAVAPFALGKYAVTFEEYDRFADTTRREKPSDRGWGRGRRPVINITWFDAVAYVEWLSWQTGQTYRLPTEAEWEYACRAGTTSPFSFGDTISTGHANYDGNYIYGNGGKGVYIEKTVEVDLFPANAWGLHNMHGNVWEWTCSEYDVGYSGTELRCVSDPNSVARRVVRGGSWFNLPRHLRAADRGRGAPADRYLGVGFRLAKTLSL
jgi:formylglycine-generating enzyme required for sulfatase activity